MKTSPIIKILQTEEEQAEYFFNREFDAVVVTDFEDFYDRMEWNFPSDEIMANKYLDNVCDRDELETEYNEYCIDNDIEDDDKDFIEWVNENYENEISDYKDENFGIMWSTVWKCDDFFKSLINELYDIGILSFDYKDNMYLCINGCGYGFYSQHWIPLFKDVLKWINEISDENYKEKIENQIERLKKLIE